MEPAIHWFRRDPRLADHQALAKAGKGARPVIGLFVLDPGILHGPDVGRSRLAYLLEALTSLDEGLRHGGSALVIRRGDPHEVVPNVAAETGSRLVTAVRDFGPYARTRDGAVATLLARAGRSVASAVGGAAGAGSNAASPAANVQCLPEALPFRASGRPGPGPILRPLPQRQGAALERRHAGACRVRATYDG